jgi:nicotinate-nucleotide pyrophosphorylase (carboxylating)
VVPAYVEATAALVTRQDCVCAGLPVARAVFHELDPEVRFDSLAAEGEVCAAGRVLARITCRARAMLTGERTALNFLQRLCGIATLARKYVEAVGRQRTRILDTRKTTPGLRMLEKYAVRMGGAQNHRFGLYDRVLIKDNHLQLTRFCGPDPIARAVSACRRAHPQLEIEVEADTLAQVEAALAAGADCILLDNMNDDEIAEAVRVVAGRCRLEVSGGMTLERVPTVAALGVDFISAGALTHSAPAIDVGLDIVSS